MITITKKELAFGFVHNHHEGQVDKAGKPYIEHVLHVYHGVKDQGEAYGLTGLLHDIVEDSEVSLDALRYAGFSNKVVAAVDAITKRDGEEYLDYLARVKENPIALAVKLVDIEHNSDMTRLPEELLEKYSHLPEKYAKAVAFLTE